MSCKSTSSGGCPVNCRCDGPDTPDCTHAEECGFCAARESQLVKAQAKLADPLWVVKAYAFRFSMFLQANVPWLVPIIDRLLHPFGICIGH